MASGRITISSLAIARTRAAEDRPYLASAFWNLIPVESKGLRTLATDKHWRLYYDPELDWGPELMSGVIQHEVWHLLRGHHERAEFQAAEPQKWNIAADCEINDDLAACGTKLPEGAMYPSKFSLPDGLMAEEYYQKLPKGSGKGKGKDPGKEGTKDGGGVATGDCGSCADGKPRSYELPDNAVGKDGKPVPKVTQIEAELITREVAKKIVEASRLRGNIPGDMAAWANQVLNPKVDWRRELAALVRHAKADMEGMVDWSYSRPSRRQIGSKIILPSMRAPEITMAIVVDTSGSMSDQYLEQCLGEVKGCIQAVGFGTVPVISCDSAVHGTQRVSKANQVALKGRGGTDMTVGIEAAALLKPRPDIILVLTDGYTPWPDQPPKRTKVVIGHLKPKDAADIAGAPAWAKSVEIEVEG